MLASVSDNLCLQGEGVACFDFRGVTAFLALGTVIWWGPSVKQRGSSGGREGGGRRLLW